MHLASTSWYDMIDAPVKRSDFYRVCNVRWPGRSATASPYPPLSSRGRYWNCGGGGGPTTANWRPPSRNRRSYWNFLPWCASACSCALIDPPARLAPGLGLACGLRLGRPLRPLPVGGGLRAGHRASGPSLRCSRSIVCFSERATWRYARRNRWLPRREPAAHLANERVRPT